MSHSDSYVFSINRPNSVSEDAVEFMLSECAKALINDETNLIGEAMRTLHYEYEVAHDCIETLIGRCLDSIADYGIHLEALRSRKSLRDVVCLVDRTSVKMTLHWV